MRRILLISLIFSAMTMVAGAPGLLASATSSGKEVAVVKYPG